MAVSPSTIAFALATCIPFGLAIRDTVRHHDPVHDSDEDSELDAARSAREARERAEQAMHDAEREAQLQHHKLMLIDLIGPEPAQLGRSFDGITIGMPTEELTQHDDRLAKLRADTGTDIRADFEQTLRRITIPLSDADCGAFGERLDGVWHAGHAAGDTTYWQSGDVHAAFQHEPGGCVLTFEQRVAVERWLDKKPGAVMPLAFLGKSAAALVADLDARATTAELQQTADIVRWHDVGPGNGVGDAELTAVLKRGKIVALEARVAVDRDTTDAIAARLTTLYGAPSDADPITWNKGRVNLGLGNGSNIDLNVSLLPP